MATNVSVQYNGGLLPDIILLTQCYNHRGTRLNAIVQLTSSRVRLGQSFKTVGYGSASCWGDLGAGSVEADVFYIPFIVSVQYIGY